MYQVTIESNIPPPFRKKTDRYPRLAEIKIGDSFICLRNDIELLRIAYISEKKTDKALNYAARKIEEPPYDYRIWRVEPARFIKT